jgi:hypothetical protein
MLKGLAHTRYKVRVLLFVALLVTLFLSMFVEAEVIQSNMSMDLYKTDEDFDMVRIPMMFGGMVQLLAVIFFTISQCTPRTKYWGNGLCAISTCCWVVDAECLACKTSTRSTISC